LGTGELAFSCAQKFLTSIKDRVPNTPEAPMQRTTDQTVAEAIEMHNDVFKYADSVDQEGERIKDSAGSFTLTAN